MKKQVLQLVSQCEDFFGKYRARQLAIKLVQCTSHIYFNLRFFLPLPYPPHYTRTALLLPYPIPIVTCSHSLESFNPVFRHPVVVFLI